MEGLWKTKREVWDEQGVETGQQLIKQRELANCNRQEPDDDDDIDYDDEDYDADCKMSNILHRARILPQEKSLAL